MPVISTRRSPSPNGSRGHAGARSKSGRSSSSRTCRRNSIQPGAMARRAADRHFRPVAITSRVIDAGRRGRYAGGVALRRQVPEGGHEENAMDHDTQRGYAPVNGLEMYYEIHGAGRPLLLLHGAYMTIDGFGALLPALAATRRVIAVEQQAHGHTADVDRPLTYEQMADD